MLVIILLPHAETEYRLITVIIIIVIVVIIDWYTVFIEGIKQAGHHVEETHPVFDTLMVWYSFVNIILNIDTLFNDLWIPLTKFCKCHTVNFFWQKKIVT